MKISTNLCILLVSISVACAATEDVQPPINSDSQPLEKGESLPPSADPKMMLFDLKVHDGEKVVSNPKIRTVEGHPMSMSVSYNETENTSFDYTWSLEEDQVKLGVAIRSPMGEESFQELKFALGEATKFETPDGRYTVSVTATNL